MARVLARVRATLKARRAGAPLHFSLLWVAAIGAALRRVAPGRAPSERATRRHGVPASARGVSRSGRGVRGNVSRLRPMRLADFG